MDTKQITNKDFSLSADQFQNYLSLEPDMKEIRNTTIEKMNELGTLGKSFAFLIDFDFQKPLIFDPDDCSELVWQTPSKANLFRKSATTKKQPEWKIQPVDYDVYQLAFNLVQKHIHAGDTYLLNLTMPSHVETNLSPEEIFFQSSAPYKIWLKNRFVCFSPEIFVRITDGTISSFPMKGTIDASIENAAEQLLNDEKEVAEHHTIVDLIRNDLSIIASEVQVERFMFIDRIKTNRGDLLQMSSQISGKLPENYAASIGTIVSKMLPAGSICGAPKSKTVEIIREVEPHDRGYYTGIFGIFDGRNLDSCVLIRYLEQNGDELIFKSGGGITFLSDCQSEYNELIQKVYVPVG